MSAADMDTKALIRRALEDAIDWQQSLRDCLHDNDPHLVEVRALLAGYRKILKRRYPPRRDRFEGARLVTIAEMRAEAAWPEGYAEGESERADEG